MSAFTCPPITLREMPDPSHPRSEAADRAVVGRPRGRLGRFVDTIWHELAKFGLIGAVAFVIDLGGMNLLTHTVLEGKVTTARVLSGVVATLFAWFGNRTWTFANRRSRPAHHEVTLFFVVNGLALGISTLSLVISHYVLGFESRLADNIATVFGIGLGTLFRFWTYRRFVFANEAMDTDTSPRHDEQTDAA